MKKKFIVCQVPNANIVETETTTTPTTMNPDSDSKVPGGWGCRHLVMILTFFGSAMSYMLRSNLSMAIVGMVHHDVNQDKSEAYYQSIDANTTLLLRYNTNNTDLVCSNLRIVKSNSTNSSPTNGEFHWDTVEQGIILGSFFWGYIITHIPGGLLADKWGAKWVFGIGLLVASVFALFTPIAARYGIIPLIIVRVIQGLGEGFIPPATHCLIAHWSPPFERCKFGAFIYAGNQAGTMLGIFISGMIIHSNFLGMGWPGVFYIEGLMGCIWFIFWSFFLFNKPSEHPRISDEERQYIEGALEGQTSKNQKITTPWRDIFLSTPVWAILIAQSGNSWGLYTLMTELPTYMHRVLRFDIQANCWLSAMPFFCMLVSAIIVSQFGDIFRARKIMSTTSSRKFFNSIGHWGCGLMLAGAAYFGCDRILAVTLLTIAIALSGLIGGGYQINHVDIAPNHSGLLMGICNGVANICGIFAPYVAGNIIKEKGSLSDWQLVFLISVAVYFADNLFYIVFASGEIQPWNDSGSSGQRDKNKSIEETVPEMSESERL